MTYFRRQALLTAFKLFDLGVMAVSFILAALPVSYLTRGTTFEQFLAIRVKLLNIFLFLFLILMWHVVFSAFGLYKSRRFGNRGRESLDVTKATLVATCLIILASSWWHVRMVTPPFIVLFFVLSCSLGIASRLSMRACLDWVRKRGRNLREIVIVGTNERAIGFARTIESKPELGYRLAGFVDVDRQGVATFRESGYPLIADLAQFPVLLRERVVDEVALALPMKSLYLQAARVAACCQEHGILVRQVANLFETNVPRRSVEDAGDDSPTTLISSPTENWATVMKRVVDLIASSVLLVALAPLFLATAMLVLAESPGPILFSQERLGLNKRRFRMYKFRTMVADAERKQAELESLNEADGPVFKIKNDPRITRIGKILRKFSIDELPQLVNVLRGDMSLVGPRPLPVRDYEGFEQDWQRRRFSVRPGLTCLWQINGRSGVSFQHWMDLDLRYIDDWSLWLDLEILVKTIPAILRGTGAV